MDFIRIIIAILLPPLGVFLQVGLRRRVLAEYPADLVWLHSGHRSRGVHHRQAVNLWIAAVNRAAISPCGFHHLAIKQPFLLQRMGLIAGLAKAVAFVRVVMGLKAMPLSCRALSMSRVCCGTTTASSSP